MTTNTDYCQLDNELTLYDPTGAPLTVQGVQMAFTKAEGKVTACRLTCRVSPLLYQQIDQHALFNLNPKMRGTMSAEPFQSEQDIEIESLLHPELLPQLMEHATTIDEAVAFLLDPDQSGADNPFLSTDHWFGLSVKQSHGDVKIGYETHWLDSSMVFPNISNNTQTLEEMAEQVLDKAGFTSSAEVATMAEQDTILESIVNFFKADEWPFTRIQNEPALRMAFQGDNGQFTCYAQARESQRQFIFYSICPIKVPENKRLLVAEFLTRANYGMIMGNFELDLRDGEVRYKTSIDVEGDRLSLPLSQHVVYPNVMMMDRYLPGIMMVAYGGLTSEQAIQQIENG